MKSFIILALSVGLSLSNQPFNKSKDVSMSSYAMADAPVEATVEKIFDAYSKRDLQNFISYFDTNVEVSLFPNKILYKGKDELRKNYAQFFETNPNFKTELLSRKTQDNRVIDEISVERIAGKVQKCTIVYEVVNGVVQKMIFL
ncbi:MAG: hypothetical protein EAZ85_07845 [Bacteroidetes bacterium]|nr:MAG: hypothetical protein EAZ85_07845 [Bacteroidota bacterium]TAG88170.1 MAG: hypothetical protein EAZ20_09090 [Bacteroidota bacterium]